MIPATAPTWFRVGRGLSVATVAAGLGLIVYAYLPRTGVTYPGGMVYALIAMFGAGVSGLGLLLLLLLHTVRWWQSRSVR